MKSLEEMGQFATVVVDPPWKLPLINFTAHDFSKALPYAQMTTEELTQLPIRAITKADGLVFCWCTNSTLGDALALIRAWGLAYKFTMVWIKPKGPQAPNSPCFNAEYVVVGRKGNPQFNETKAFRTANSWPSRAHSEKPEGFYDLLRRVAPSPRLDVFGRRRIAGFTSWGHEAPDGPPPTDYYQTVLT